jgi:hypothetical protein
MVFSCQRYVLTIVLAGRPSANCCNNPTINKANVFQVIDLAFFLQVELNQYILKLHCLELHIWVKGFVATCLLGYNIICQFTHILTNDAQELTL